MPSTLKRKALSRSKRVAEPDDGILASDDESDEFTQDPSDAYVKEAESSGSGSHVADEDEATQWQPDSWDGDDFASDDGEDSMDSDGEDQVENSTTLRDGLESLPLATLAKAQRMISHESKHTRSVGRPSNDADSRVEHVLSQLADAQRRKGKQASAWNQVGRRTDNSRLNDLTGDNSSQKPSKHAPATMSSKKQVTRLRQVVELPKSQRRDPRFSHVSAGDDHLQMHHKSYSFLPELMKSELSELRRALAAATKAERTCTQAERPAWSEERERLELRIARTRSRSERAEREAREREVFTRARKDEMEKRKQGKGAWHLKKAAKRELLLTSRFEELEAQGGNLAVRKAMDKKRRKTASKDKKTRPFRTSLNHTSKGEVDGTRRRA